MASQTAQLLESRWVAWSGISGSCKTNVRCLHKWEL